MKPTDEFLYLLVNRPSMLGIATFHDLNLFLSGFEVALKITYKLDVQSFILEHSLINSDLKISNRPWYFAIHERNNHNLEKTLEEVAHILYNVVEQTNFNNSHTKI